MSTFPGARGPNEFWGNKADFDGSTGYLSRTSALTGITASKTVSICLWIRRGAINVQNNVLRFTNLAESRDFSIVFNSSNSIDFYGASSASGGAVGFTGVGSYTSTTDYYCVMLSVDLTNSAKRSCYINNSAAAGSWYLYNDRAICFDEMVRPTIGARWSGTDYVSKFNGGLAELYLTTDYIDFSQEVNRLKFRDCFGSPTNLPELITKGEVPNPAIYMRFDPSNFGKNYGTGGDFTVNGSILDGGNL